MSAITIALALTAVLYTVNLDRDCKRRIARNRARRGRKRGLGRGALSGR